MSVITIKDAAMSPGGKPVTLLGGPCDGAVRWCNIDCASVDICIDYSAICSINREVNTLYDIHWVPCVRGSTVTVQRGFGLHTGLTARGRELYRGLIDEAMREGARGE